MTDFDFIARANPEWVEAQYRAWRRDPRSVDERWALVFAGFDFAGGRAAAAAPPVVDDLVHSYRELGHLAADLDPLGSSPRQHPLLRLEEFGFSERDLGRIVHPGSFRGLGPVTLGELVAALEETYCRTLGVEYLGVDDKRRREWLQERMEPSRNRPALDAAARRAILARLIQAETFEQFLGSRYPGQKRFSLEGGEALITLLDTLIEDGAALGIEEMVFGMPHRGRLNVLAHVLRKPLDVVLAEFEGDVLPPDDLGDGDVKYHLGHSHDHRTAGGRVVHLSMSPNPSHLEAVDPVVEGLVRAKQAYRGDAERRRVVPVLLHGDAAFVGQGIVYETLALSQLEGFTTGGTVHVIINNQIGFTTSPAEYRSSRYPSDPANLLRAPVFHVNADDPEAVVQAARLAVGFRQAFTVDVFIDFICYRRHGHNELDDPTLTHPTLYRLIRDHPSVATLYARRLVQAGVVTEADVRRLREEATTALERAREAAREGRPRRTVQVFGGAWTGLGWAGEDWSAATAVDAGRLRRIADGLRRLPEGFTPHRRLAKLLEERWTQVSRGEGLDWGTAELLAYGSLLLEGTPVRLCGQDTARGTFSHRHAVLVDAETGATWVPLNHLAPDQALIEVINSPLSEAAVLGFEYGMASADPRRLVIWEAQFGDFVNNAQAVIDQFIAAAESKWQRMNGLTLFLPHGYEGQGPEHSSARPERFLQLCAEGNMQVVQPTLPAQLFHVLRRQIHRRFRKPLIVLTPKSLLRHPRSVSRLADLADGAFRLVLDDPRQPDPAEVRRVLLCSGKIFFPLAERRDEAERGDLAIVRLEQLYPFPAAEVGALLRRYAAAPDVVWVQDEPANQGAWGFVRWRLEELLGGRRLRYIGREEAASPATGSFQAHQAEEEALLGEALKRTE